MYRFRTIENLLGAHQELEKQEIYFAPSDVLNDPMEGLLDVFWHGDSVVWENLLRHYLMCLERVFFIYSFSGETHRLTTEDIPILKNRFQFPTKEYEAIYGEIENYFLGFDNIKQFPTGLAGRDSEIRRDELLIHLKTVHAFAIEAITRVYHKHGLIKMQSSVNGIEALIKFTGNKSSLTKLIADAERSFPSFKKLSDKFFSAAMKTVKEIDFVKLYYEHELSKNKFFVLYNFSELYINKIEELVYPKWYTACFMSHCNNSSVWGHYGDKHQGVCLKFKTYVKEDKQHIDLKRVYGYGEGPIIDMVSHKFRQISYQNKHVAINFFKSIGKYPEWLLRMMWYTDANGNMSAVADSIANDASVKKGWMDDHWANFYTSVTTKLTDWEYENEYRLILTDIFHEYDTIERRKARYDFNDLEGIIFGIKTSVENKAKIVKIIEAKCKESGRNDFQFYQAYYSKETGKIEHELLRLLKPQ